MKSCWNTCIYYQVIDFLMYSKARGSSSSACENFFILSEKTLNLHNTNKMRKSCVYMGKSASEGMWENETIGAVDRAMIDGWERLGKLAAEEV